MIASYYSLSTSKKPDRYGTLPLGRSCTGKSRQRIQSTLWRRILRLLRRTSGAPRLPHAGTWQRGWARPQAR